LIRSAGEKWAPVSVAGKSRREPRRRGNPIDTGGPTIFAALKQQLRLKLAPQKAPVEIMAIDRAEKPAENEPSGSRRFQV
jgi:uncharacterized protein (TIGR03435 family)